MYVSYFSKAHICKPLSVYACLHAVSASEVLPRERKAKEEKTVTIGVASVDLSPLLLGEILYTIKHACIWQFGYTKIRV